MSSSNFTKLSPSWVETIDPKSGRPYYANTKTKEVTWTRPDEAIEKELAELKRKKKPSKQAEDKWIERQDPRTGRTYYYNPKLKETSWHRPTQVVGTDVHTQAEAKGAWVERVDPRTGRTYFYNPVLGRTSWVNPDAQDDMKLATGNNNPDKVSAFKRISMNVANRLSGAFGLGGSSNVQNTASETQRNSARFSLNLPAMPINRNQARTSLRIGADNPAVLDLDKFAALRALKDQKPNVRLSLAQPQTPKVEDALLIKLEELLENVKVDYPIQSFALYASGKFKDIKGGFLSGKSVPAKDRIYHQTTPMKTALHDLKDSNLTSDAVLGFRLILWHCGDKATKKSSDVLAQEFASLGVSTADSLKDELYCQLMKQSNKNDGSSSLERCWELIALVAGCFSPTDVLKPYVLSHFRDAVDTPPTARISVLARYAMLRMERFSPRLEPPSMQEIAAVRSVSPVDLRVKLISAPSINIQVDSWVTIQDIRKQIESRFQIRDGSPFTLYEVNKFEQERVLDDTDNILDLVAFWERLGGDFDCLYKMRLFFDISEDDTAAIELAYLQAVSEVLDEAYPCSEEDAITLAAFEAQEKFGDYTGDDVFGEELAGYLPPKYYHPDTAPAMKERIFEEYDKLKGAGKLQCMINYLNFIKQWKYYGSAYYQAKPVQLKILGKEFPELVYLGINAKGVLIIDPPSLNLIAEYPYSEIVTWGHSVENFVLVIGNMVRSTKLFFHSEDGQEMNSLITTYVTKLMEAQTEEEQNDLMMKHFEE